MRLPMSLFIVILPRRFLIYIDYYCRQVSHGSSRTIPQTITFQLVSVLRPCSFWIVWLTYIFTIPRIIENAGDSVSYHHTYRVLYCSYEPGSFQTKHVVIEYLLPTVSRDSFDNLQTILVLYDFDVPCFIADTCRVSSTEINAIIHTNILDKSLAVHVVVICSIAAVLLFWHFPWLFGMFWGCFWFSLFLGLVLQLNLVLYCFRPVFGHLLR